MVHKMTKKDKQLVKKLEILRDQREYFRTKLDDLDRDIIDLEEELEKRTGSKW